MVGGGGGVRRGIFYGLECICVCVCVCVCVGFFFFS